MKAETVLANVLNKISLNTKEIAEVKSQTKGVLAILKKAKLNAEIGGSLAKGTMLKKDNQDVDIFITFTQKELPSFEDKIAKTKLPYEVIHGSRDYIQIKRENIIFELIPVLKPDKSGKIENITDFSLTHVKYIKKVINKNKKLADEIKLAKAFCHAQKCYGAESYIGGFSGYSLEVLVSHYGSFINFLKKIQTEQVIDPLKQFKNKNEIFRELNQSKLQSPIILIDPTYKYRNVCAGLTKEVYEFFLTKAKEFIKSPSENFFEKKEFDLDNFVQDAKNKSLSVFEITINTNKQEGDIAGTKMKKLFKFLIKELERKEQKVISSEFVYNREKEARGYLAIDRKEVREIIGPKQEMKEAVEAFRKVRKEVYSSKGHICAKEKVSIEEIFKNNYYKAESMSTGFSFKKIN